MSGSHNPLTLLLVEDSEDDAFFFRYTLRKTSAACTVTHLTNGLAALEYLDAARSGADDAPPWPDMVFLDLKLPSVSGFEVLEWVRSRNLGPQLDIAVLSGSEQPADVARALELGASSYLVKPITVEQLRSRLASCAKMRAAASPRESQPSTLGP